MATFKSVGHRKKLDEATMSMLLKKKRTGKKPQENENQGATTDRKV